ncbi:hypothetical protein, partial [Psychrobacillus psychrotolerans]|uniref:hypothetical protein n=1 Tax=Psychrobacillus psychrotolerans TaxID=126156 RepID=UPI003C770B6A
MSINVTTDKSIEEICTLLGISETVLLKLQEISKDEFSTDQKSFESNKTAIFVINKYQEHLGT